MYKLKPKANNKNTIEITKCNKTIFKILQKQCYNCLLNKYSICVITGLLFILVLLINFFLQKFFKEIIEFPVLKISASSFKIEDQFHRYVQPKLNKILTPFCTDVSY